MDQFLGGRSVIAKIWCEELRLEKIGLNDKFFDVGGHSLVSNKVIGRIEQELGVQINFRDIMLETLGQLAKSCKKQSYLNRVIGDQGNES